MIIFLSVLIIVMYLYTEFNQHRLIFNRYSQSKKVLYGLLFLPVLPVLVSFFDKLNIEYRLWLWFINAVYLMWLWSKAHAHYHFFNSKAADQTIEVQKWLSRVKMLTLFNQICIIFYYFN